MSKKNLVLIGSHLWDNPEKHAATSFCVHIDQELPRTEGDIEVFAFEEVSLGMQDGRLFLLLPDGRKFFRGDADMPDWALLYVVPPRATKLLETLGITCFSSYEMQGTVVDKMVSHILFADDFAQPDTLFYNGLITPDTLGYPFMLKGVGGCCGVNVKKTDNADEVKSFEMGRAEDDLVMYQQLMPTADDLRVYILGDKILGAVLRKPKAGIWKANLEFEPERSVYELSSKERKSIENAMEKLPPHKRGLHTFDFLFNDARELVFCESNCDVGTNALDAAGYGDDIFLRYIDYIRREMSTLAR